MAYLKDQYKATFYQEKVIKQKNTKEKLRKSFVGPMIIGIVGSSNWIGASLNG